MGIRYQPGVSNVIYRYFDSDWAQSQRDRESIARYVFMLSGGAISRLSPKQTAIVQSSLQAEYLPLSFAVREALWYEIFKVPLRLVPTPMYISKDDDGSIQMTKDMNMNDRTRLVDVKCRMIIDYLKNDRARLKRIASKEHILGIRTKALGQVLVCVCSEGMGMYTNT